MNYTQLTDDKKAQIDILLEQGLSMRKTAQVLGIDYSTISRYKLNKCPYDIELEHIKWCT